MFFRLSSVELALILLAIVLGTTLLGDFVGRRLRGRAELREPFGVVQAALLGLVALLLAFGLTMAVGRYDARRAAVVSDANAIGTAYLRAQTLKEPIRTRSLVAFRQYTDADIRLANSVPGTRDAREAIAAHAGPPDVWTQRFGDMELRIRPATPDGETLDFEVADAGHC